MVNPKLSIIIPCFNIEIHLSKCIESVLKQSFADFELLLLDDGSTDGTLAVCESFKAIDDRIKVFSHENRGVSYTRNRGIDLAIGDYLMFIDGDDYLEFDYLGKHLDASESDTIVLSGFLNEKRNSIVENENFKHCLDFCNFKIYYENQILKLLQYEVLSTPCCKLYNLKTIKENSIYFDENVTYQEDLLFNINYFSFFKKYRVLGYFGYHYVSHSNSSTSKFHSNFSQTEILYNKLIAYATNEVDTLILRVFLMQSLLRRISNIFHSDNNISFLEKKGQVDQVFRSSAFVYSVKSVNNLPISLAFKKLLQLKCSFLITIYFLIRRFILN